MHSIGTPPASSHESSQDFAADQKYEVILRESLAYARAESAEHRTSDPARGRAMALVATKIEEALFYLVYKVP